MFYNCSYLRQDVFQKYLISCSFILILLFIDELLLCIKKNLNFLLFVVMILHHYFLHGGILDTSIKYNTFHHNFLIIIMINFGFFLPANAPISRRCRRNIKCNHSTGRVCFLMHSIWCYPYSWNQLAF